MWELPWSSSEVDAEALEELELPRLELAFFFGAARLPPLSFDLAGGGGEDESESELLSNFSLALFLTGALSEELELLTFFEALFASTVGSAFLTPAFLISAFLASALFREVGSLTSCTLTVGILVDGVLEGVPGREPVLLRLRGVSGLSAPPRRAARLSFSFRISSSTSSSMPIMASWTERGDPLVLRGELARASARFFFFFFRSSSESSENESSMLFIGFLPLAGEAGGSSEVEASGVSSASSIATMTPR